MPTRFTFEIELSDLHASKPAESLAAQLRIIADKFEADGVGETSGPIYSPFGWIGTWRMFTQPITKVTHRTRGGEYAVLGHGTVQTDTPIEDCEKLVIYRDTDMKYWLRLPSEMEDGRFVRIDS